MDYCTNKILLLRMSLHAIRYYHKCACAIVHKYVCFCNMSDRIKISLRHGSFRRAYCIILLCVALISCFYLTLTMKNLTSLEVIFSPVPINVVAENNTPCSGFGKSATKDDNKCEKRFPNALIIGVEKGGTGALLRFLSQHPQIVIKVNEL